MANVLKLSADKRELTGRKVKQLRKNGIIPANVFGKGLPSKSVQVEGQSFHEIFEDSGETGLINLAINGDKPISVLVSDIQVDPISMNAIHIDFRAVDLKEKIITHVPVELIGESPAEKLKAIVVQNLDEIEVEALPGELPDSFEVDISILQNIGDIISVEQLKGTIAGVEIKNDPKTVVVMVQEVKEEVEPTEDTLEQAETEIENEVADEGRQD